MQYDDFILQIVPDGDRYTVRVVASPDGESSARFEPPVRPFSVDGLDGLLRSSRDAARGVSGVPTGNLTPSRPPEEEVGRRLYDALFQPAIRHRFERSWARIEPRTGHGLRIKIKLDPADPRGHLLARLPWELLHPGGRDGFLALSRRTPVVRYLDVPRALHRAPLPRPFRILAVPSQPPGTRPLDLREEIAELSDACPDDRTRLDVLDRPTIRALRTRLLDAVDRNAPYHALHVMGHGILGGPGTESALLFENETGACCPVTGRALALHLRDLPTLRLVVLNACFSGRGTDAFTGVADALVLGGIPAVVAMQAPILDRDATRFTATLYDRLAQGDPVDTAVTEARLRLFDSTASGEAWSTPMLFMRTPDGRLFAPPAPAMGTASPGRWPLSWLSDRAGREAPPILSTDPEGPGRGLLACRVGTSLVVGRCHDSQLRPAALGRLRRSGEERVHWVTSWNQARLPQLWLRIGWSWQDGAPRLTVENLTDYSTRPVTLAPVTGGLQGEPIEPGARRSLAGPAPGRGELVLATVPGSQTVAASPPESPADPGLVLRLVADATDPSIPVLRATGVSFRPVPEASCMRPIRFLGVWIPLPLDDLRLRLERLAQPLGVPLAPDVEGATLWITNEDGAGAVMSIDPPGLAAPKPAPPPPPSHTDEPPTGRADRPIARQPRGTNLR